ncbi:CatB-related O-acetyltransferase [Sphingomonas corticis]|jgi:acetyltransferase-like isoleucine patch superfamily enzyme|uniref:CatB-related O-acetyltransferase n=1 Tax=Sphingomonas corticis TaxID=2722791 RepID=A0ABX1CK38_9SPHN|nr:CatB-related O-acetyltransferase [Sphingomonas corticis]NJR77273.1 CatB-related O-acetyltransferase [Sphingomonas corticis]
MFSNLVDRLKVRFARGGEYDSVSLRRHFARKHDIAIGLYTFGAFDRWRMPPGTRIGRYCSIARNARLVEADHPVGNLTTHPFLYMPAFGVTQAQKEAVPGQVIEDDVWLSHNVTVLPGCKRIGRGAIVGAGAVVIADVPRYAVAVGVPAKVVRYRFPTEVQAAIEATRWWELDKQQLATGLRAAPAFATAPSAEGARAFFRAVHGRELEMPPTA